VESFNDFLGSPSPQIAGFRTMHDACLSHTALAGRKATAD